MADIRCTNCGKNNPDFLDVCQFCQTPLIPPDMLHIGEEPTKKNTDELEEILPDWLKEARQQGKNAEAADEAFQPQSKPRVQKDEPPDLLAGLMSQADSDEEEVPDWLADIVSPAAKEAPKAPVLAEKEPSDFLAQFTEPEIREETPASMGGQQDELTDWFKAPAEPAAASDDDWMKDLAAFNAEPEAPAAKEPEDLSWLRDLEAASKGGETSEQQKQAAFDFPAASDDDLGWLDNLGGVTAPGLEQPAPAPSAGPENDLSWLDSLGGTPAPTFEEPVPAQPSASDEDLSWLKDLGAEPAPAFDEPVTAQPSASDEDLSWLKDLGATPVPATEEPVTAQPPASDEDLSWLDALGKTAEPATEAPVPSQGDLSWLNDLGGTAEPSAPAFADTGELYGGQEPPATAKPFRTAPLNELLGDEAFKDTTPDWLKNALEEPSMPPPGAVTMDWFAQQDKSSETEPAAPTQGEPASPQPAFDFSQGDPSAQDVDSLFNMQMPDWLSSETEEAEAPQPEAESAPQPAFTDEGEALAPVELPSWVQAMRPVDSSVSEVPATADQVTEREGPLAGFRGVIPSAPIGSSLRPKPFSMKLQVTEEQQAGASLLEQVIASETTVQPRREAARASTQKALRWVLSGLFLVVLGVVLALGLQTMQIPSSGAERLSEVVAGVPEGEPVLVVIDYEPSFSGELEAAAGPLLDQLAMSKRSAFSFVSMSPNGAGLVDRLLSNTGISKPAEENGLGYQPGAQYFNLGFLAGGSSGVLRFIQAPADEFSQYAAVVLLTDNVESGRVWVEQLEIAGQSAKPLFLVASAQAGPMFQPYVDSGQADVMVNGLADAAKYELVNVSRPGTARLYWDAFGYGIMLAVIAIILGSLWSVYMRIREQRAEAEQG